MNEEVMPTVPGRVMLRAVQILCAGKGTYHTLYVIYAPRSVDGYTLRDSNDSEAIAQRVGIFNWDAPVREVNLAVARAISELIKLGFA